MCEQGLSSWCVPASLGKKKKKAFVSIFGALSSLAKIPLVAWALCELLIALLSCRRPQSHLVTRGGQG